MAKINLLPWREQRRESQKRQFLAMLAGSLISACLLIWLADQYLSSQIDRQNARNTFMRAEVAALDRNIREISDLKKRRQQLLDRIKIIQDLQHNRPIVAHVFDQIIRTLPEGVYFNEVRMLGTNVSLVGLSESNTRVSTLMRNLDASEWLKSPNLIEVKAANGREIGQRSRFQLNVQQVIPQASPAPSGAKSP